MKPECHPYYMALAVTVAARADCVGQKVGAVLVRSNRVLATGYNGTPEGWPNCSAAGCVRCANRQKVGSKKGYASGNGYDKCICVHAEMNALAAAARYGTAVEGSTAYVTHLPCFSCSKELIQAGVHRVYYVQEMAAPTSHGAGGKKNRRKVKGELERTQAQLMGALKAEPIAREAVTAAVATALTNFGATQVIVA